MKPTDDESRCLIVTDFTHTLFVDAGAGSGKTTSMISRILMLILQGLTDIREIVAITFTNDGAASLKSKIQRELEKALGSDSYSPVNGVVIPIGEAERKRVGTALMYLPLAQFSTIHSFCLTLLKERPVEAGIDPKFEMNTEGIPTSSFDEAWSRFIIGMAQTEDPFLKLIVGESIPLGELERIARMKYGNPDLEIYTEKAERLSDRTVDVAFDVVCTCAQEMHDRLDELQSGANTGAGSERLQFVSDLQERVESCRTTPDRLKLLLTMSIHDKWTKKQGFFSERSVRLEQTQGSVRKRHYDYLHSKAAEFVKKFEKYFEEYRKKTSTLEFQDLLYLARTMLKENREVREYFKHKFRYLFIDETQDVDPLQIEVVFFLSEKASTFAGDWTDVELEPSRLFMVGDPKQSIYRFRRADIVMYEQAKEVVKRQGGKILSLDKNFRSAAPLIGFTNSHFTRSFQEFEAQIEEKLQPGYAPLEAAAPRQSRLGNHIYAIRPPDGAGKQVKKDSLADETARITGFIRHMTGPDGPSITDATTGEQRPIRHDDIMILMRAFTDIGTYTQAFEDAGIPYYEVGGRTFFDTEDVRGLVQALKAIDEPTDTVSLFGALKSSVIGITDQALYDFVSGGKRLNIFGGDKEQSDVLNLALALFQKLYYEREKLRPSGVLRELFNISGICHIVLSEPNGVQKSSKYFRLLELLYEIESDQTLSFRSIVSRLESVMNLDDPQLANVTITQSGEDAVKLTTIHRAKGLESPVVVIANATTSEKQVSPDYFVLRDEAKIVIPYMKDGGFYSKNPDDLIALEQQKEDCESERLRYVAATRARDILAVCVSSEEENAGKFNGKFAPSLLKNKGVGEVESEVVQERTDEAKKGKMTDLAKVVGEARMLRADKLDALYGRLSGIASPFVSVHETMEIDPELFRVKRKSRGRGFGNVIHRIMQQYVSIDGFDVMTVLDQWLEDENVPRRYRNDALEAFERLCRNDYVREARQAKEKHCEWEFFVKSEGKIISGVIDLVYKNPAGEWVVVDYKTDDISDPGRKKKLDELYGGQVRQYARAFEEITGESIKRSAIVHSDSIVATSMDLASPM